MRVRSFLWKSLMKNSILPSRRHTIQRRALVKTLEELGIGRPSTYAPTITTILARRYVAKENKNICIVTELGEVVNQYHEAGFPVYRG